MPKRSRTPAKQARAQTRASQTPARSSSGKRGPLERRQTAIKVLAILSAATMLLTLVAGAATAQTDSRGLESRRIEDAVERAERLGRAFGDPQAAEKLRIGILRQLTQRAELPEPPQRIPDPGGVNMLASWDGDSGIQILDDGLDRQVANFLRRSGTTTQLRDVEGGTRRGTTGQPIVCPIAGPVRFINDWGFPRSGGRTHRGNDLFALQGTPIVAVADSIVTSVSRVDTGLGGLHVSYIDENGDRWYNAHLERVEDGITPGATIRQGETVGYVGRSGNARTTPPHNHIQWHPANGEAQNPYFQLRTACP